MQELIIPEKTSVFEFEEVYPFRAAQEQAEKKKLNAFGLMARLNPLKRPKEDTVLFQRQECRLEPFWIIEAQRIIDYSCQVTYPVQVHNPYAQSIRVFDRQCEVSRQKDKAKIDVNVIESCHRKIDYACIVDGMQRDIKETSLESYIKKYKFKEWSPTEEGSIEVIKPLLTAQGIIQKAQAHLAAEAINASEIKTDSVTVSKLQLYLHPVFAFEYRWTTEDKLGVIEVDGLTGEVVEDGTWFKDKLDKVMTKETLIDVGAELSGTVLPGSGAIIRLAGRLSD